MNWNYRLNSLFYAKTKIWDKTENMHLSRLDVETNPQIKSVDFISVIDFGTVCSCILFPSSLYLGTSFFIIRSMGGVLNFVPPSGRFNFYDRRLIDRQNEC